MAKTSKRFVREVKGFCIDFLMVWDIYSPPQIYCSQFNKNSMAQHFNDETFEEEVLRAEKPVLVDFYAEWCGPCKMMAPVIDELVEELKDTWIVCKVNVDESPNTAGKYGIQSIPTLIVFKKGEEVNRSIGGQSKEAIKAMVEG